MLVAKYTFFQILTYCIRQRTPEDEKEKSRWVERFEVMPHEMVFDVKARAEGRIEELRKENPAAQYVVEIEQGRTIERLISNVLQAYQCLPPQKVRAVPEGVEPPRAPFIGVILEYPPPLDMPDARPQETLPARATPDERKYPRHVEVMNESGKQIARYEL